MKLAIPAKFANDWTALFAAALLSAAPIRAEATKVGFSGAEDRQWAEKPLVVGVWYPTAAPAEEPSARRLCPDRRPGRRRRRRAAAADRDVPWQPAALQNHYDTAIALAKAGFVAAAVSHTGDTHDDQSRAVFVMDRPQHIHRLIDYMLSEWPDHARIDAGRVGMFGFSIGGFTALVAVGGVPDLSLYRSPRPRASRLFTMHRSSSAAARARDVRDASLEIPASTWVHDSRIKAAVVAAPALGYTFGREGLKDVTVPVQLWRAADDHILPQSGLRRSRPHRPAEPARVPRGRKRRPFRLPGTLHAICCGNSRPRSASPAWFRPDRIPPDLQ